MDTFFLKTEKNGCAKNTGGNILVGKAGGEKTVADAGG